MKKKVSSGGVMCEPRCQHHRDDDVVQAVCLSVVEAPLCIERQQPRARVDRRPTSWEEEASVEVRLPFDVETLPFESGDSAAIRAIAALL